MDRKQLNEIAKALALVVHNSIAWEESLDGDATEDIAKTFLKELNSLNGNV